MGPRLLSRGEGPPCGLFFSCLELQWGRGFSAAERTSCRHHPDRFNTLQWGRGFSAAERVRGITTTKGEPSLQWGRGFSAAERTLKTSLGLTIGSFNGAAASQPRRGMR